MDKIIKFCKMFIWLMLAIFVAIISFGFIYMFVAMALTH